MKVYLDPVQEGRRINLDKPVMLIGRHEDCDIVLRGSRKISRRHCCLAQVDSRLLVRDLGSMNGVTINGRRVQKEAQLIIGDEITIGDVPFILRLQGPAERNAVNNPRRVRGEETPDRNLNSPRSSNAPLIVPPQGPQTARELSQEFPVPIHDDRGEEFLVESSQRDTPPAIPKFPPEGRRARPGFTPSMKLPSDMVPPPKSDHDIYLLRESDEI